MIECIVIKAIRACNLRCDYCYYINDETQEYGRVIADGTVERLYETLSRHARGRPVELVWHGGEPLMLGPERFERLLSMQRAHFDEGAVANKVQTNGSLVDAAWIEFFRRHAISVGVSLDGLREAHDRHRRKANGRGSFFEAMRAIRLLRNGGIEVGVLAVVDGSGSGAETMRFLNRLGVGSVEFLLPISNHALRDAGKAQALDFAGIGRFLREAYLQWLDLDAPRVPVDLFEALVLNAFGRPNDYAYTGPSLDALSNYVILETDGTICLDEEYGQLDRYGIAAQYGLGCNVHDDGFSFDLASDRLRGLIAERGLARLPDDCADCRVRTICRASHPGTRYSDAGRTFNRKSVYCNEMFDLADVVLTTIGLAGMADRVKDPGLGKRAARAASMVPEVPSGPSAR